MAFPPPNSPPAQSPASSLAPAFGLRDGRLWTIWLWSTILGLGAGGVDAVLNEFGDRAAQRAALILPFKELGETGRRELKEEIMATAGVTNVNWISPQSLAQRTASSISRQLWGELSLDDDGWLPWTAEVRFEDPIADPAGIKEIIAALDRNEQIRLIRWDQKTIENEAHNANRVRTIAIPIGLLILGLGGAALRLAPGQTSIGWGMRAALALVPALIVAATLLAAKSLSAPIGPGSLAMGAATAFILAGLIAPMLIQRTNLKRTGATLGK